MHVTVGSVLLTSSTIAHASLDNKTNHKERTTFIASQAFLVCFFVNKISTQTKR